MAHDGAGGEPPLIRLPELTEDDAKRLSAGPFGATLLHTVTGYTTWFGITTPSDDDTPKLQNGTAFFIRTPKILLAVTAKHVFEEGYLKAKVSSGRVGCQLGNMDLHPEERLVGLGKSCDIAKFRINHDELSQIGKTAITYWPPQGPTEGKGIFFAGFPGKEVIRVGRREYSLGIIAGSGVARNVMGHQITSVIEHEYLIDTLKLGLPRSGLDIGGMSGGPVLTVIESHSLIYWRIGGVIVQGWPTADMIVAHRADMIEEDGKILG
jgi:hypothetical protein